MKHNYLDNYHGPEIDAYGYYYFQDNQFSQGFGPGENPIEPGRYRLIWSKNCQFSNRGPIVIDLLGLLDVISINNVKSKRYNNDSGWEFVYDENGTDPVLGLQRLKDAYLNADPHYSMRPTVPALVDVKTKKVVNNDYHHLTNYFEKDFKPFHKPGAPDLYPEDMQEDIDQANVWVFDNINEPVYRTTFAKSKEAFWDAYHDFYTSMDVLEDHLAENRFFFGDYVTDVDVRIYTCISKLDNRYTLQMGNTYKRLVDYPNLWAYARDLYQIPAFKRYTDFDDFANPTQEATGDKVKTPNERFLGQIDFDQIWSQPHNRSAVSSDPANKFMYAKEGEDE